MINLRLGRAACGLLGFTASTPAAAISLALLLGPGNLGNGGANPLGLPPGGADVAGKIISDGGFEATLSIVPGVLAGYRWRDDGVYLSLGGGALIDANGVGFGIYSALGYVSGKGAGLHFNAEYMQSLGVGSGHLLAPGAGRLGALWQF